MKDEKITPVNEAAIYLLNIV